VNLFRESVRVGQKWKEAYSRAEKEMAVGAKPWNFDSTLLFAHVDAFGQRCVDLEDICLYQMQFAPTDPMPVFPGLIGGKLKTDLRQVYVL